MVMAVEMPVTDQPVSLRDRQKEDRQRKHGADRDAAEQATGGDDHPPIEFWRPDLREQHEILLAIAGAGARRGRHAPKSYGPARESTNLEKKI